MDSMKQLGERIKTERIAQGYSAKAAAKAAEISRDTWRKIEAGESVQDTKRHRAMKLLGISSENAEWGQVGRLEDHAADMSGMVDLNLMFSQAIRFCATVGLLVPAAREEAERVSVSLSSLFAHGLDLWDRQSPMDRDDDEDEPHVLTGIAGGGDEGDERSAAASQAPEVGPAEQPTKELSEETHSLPAAADESAIEDSGENSI